MPKYTRRVEVEDLNRNFWVIGLSMSAIAAYLFDDSSPIKTIVKNSLSEILLLWENVMYLWAAVELLNEKKGEAPEPEPEPIPYNGSNTVFLVIDLPRALDKPYRDINEFVNEYEDWFEVTSQGEEINGVRGKLRQFEKIYPNKHLAFLLRCRIGNYEKDYYHTEIYPYVAFFDANGPGGAKNWKYVKLYNQKLGPDAQTHNKWPFGFTLRIDSATEAGEGYYPNSLYLVLDIRQRVYGVRENSDLNKPNLYYFHWPLSEMPPYEGYKKPGTNSKVPTPPEETKSGAVANTYRAMVRIKPTISNGYSDEQAQPNCINVKIQFEIEDIARKLHWLTLASGGEESASDDKYLDYKDAQGTPHNPSHNIISSSQILINSQEGQTNKEPATIDAGREIGIGWGKWGQRYDSSTNPNGTKAGFSDNFRDSGFLGSLCDMMTYRGVSEANSSSNLS